MTLVGDGSEIRGSDVFDTWRASGSIWESVDTVPVFADTGQCLRPGCAAAEQVRVDGQPRHRTETLPGPTDYAIDGARHVILGDDPAGHIVEVTTRTSWINVLADDVTIRSLVMRDAANAAQRGGVEVDGVNRFTLVNSHLSGAHGVNLSIRGGSGHQIVDSELALAGQLGLRIENASDVIVERTHIHGNGGAGYDPGWEAGGLKALTVTRLAVRDSEVDHNAGQGIWCDAGCRDMTVSGDRVHDNDRIGIFFEISDGASIAGNRVWSNGWGDPVWVWGSGIVVSSASNAIVRSNVVVWNAGGIAVVGQPRGEPWETIQEVRIDGNVIAISLLSIPPGMNPALLAWDQEAHLPSMFSTTGGNGSGGNLLWSSPEIPAGCLYRWDGCHDSVDAYAAAGADLGTRVVTSDELDRILQGASIPARS